MKWYRITETEPAKGLTVMTKISDKDGDRNEQPLKRENLWWHPDGKMYVYYTPTHWRKLEPHELSKTNSHE